MSNFSFSRFFGEMWSGKNRKKNKNRKTVSRRPIMLRFEDLEDRLAPSVVTTSLSPPPTVSNATDNISVDQIVGPTSTNFLSEGFDAQVAIDPLNPLKMVEVHILAGTAAPAASFLEGDFSVDGGQTWVALGAVPDILDPNLKAAAFALDESPTSLLTDPTIFTSSTLRKTQPPPAALHGRE